MVWQFVSVAHSSSRACLVPVYWPEVLILSRLLDRVFETPLAVRGLQPASPEGSHAALSLLSTGSIETARLP